MDFKISAAMVAKLETKHGITPKEVAECFANRAGRYFSDTREEHQTDPPSYWFVAATDKGRILKVVFVRYPTFYAIKTAYEPTDGSDRVYEQLCERFPL